MRASIVIAACNEGDKLWKTIQSCTDTAAHLGCEMLVVDDASTDGCVAEAHRRFPELRVITNRSRLGGPAAKDLAARKALGQVLVFVDGHCKPSPGAIERLIDDVEELRGDAIFVPRVPALDSESWEIETNAVGYGDRPSPEDRRHLAARTDHATLRDPVRPAFASRGSHR